MSGIGTGYDLGVNTYSPDGKIFQTEYAQKAVDNSGTVVGLLCKDGVVLGVEKTVISKLMVQGTNKRIFHVDKHAGIAIGGLVADGRMLVNRAASDCSEYKRFYGSPVSGAVLSERLASYMHAFNLYGSMRPFGAAALIATYDTKGPALWLVDPSGGAHKYHGAAVGKGRQGAKTEIEKLPLGELSCREAVMAIAKLITSGHEEEKAFELELSWVCDESGKVHTRVPEELVAEAMAAAKAAMEDSDMDDDDDDDDDDDE